MRTIIILVFLACGLAVSGQVRINEILSANMNGILDEDKDFSDWIELYNAGEDAVNLTGYGLSDKLTTPYEWTFPVMNLPPHGYLMVFASGKDRKTIPMNYQTIIDVGETWRYIVPANDINSWQQPDFDDSSWSSGKSSFGYSDNDDTTTIPVSSFSIYIRKEFVISDLSNIARLILSMDYDDGFVAWINGIEIARSNMGNKGENVSFNQPADNAREAVMYTGGEPEYYEIEDLASILIEGINVIAIQVHNNQIGSSDLSLVPFLTIGRLTDGIQDSSPFLTFSSGGMLHTNFKMDVDSEAVYLFNKSGTLIDSGGGVKMIKDVSYGRSIADPSQWCFYGYPSPGAKNAARGTGPVQSGAVTFSPAGGKFIASVSVTISTPDIQDTIYYTTDGSLPQKSDTRYIGAITLNTNRVLRARTIRGDRLPGPTGAATFVTGKNHDVPIICLSTEPSNLWDDNFGMYSFGLQPIGEYPYYDANFWKDWERPMHMEFYDIQGNKKIDQEVGAKIFGGWSRAQDQKSVALKARNSYGKGSLRYTFFTERTNDKFESIVLRNSGNDNMGLQFHDSFMTGLTRNMNTDRQAFQPAAIYLNGQYWGLLNIRERVSVDYIAGNHHVNADSVNLLEGGGSVIDGGNASYNAIINYLNTKTTLQNDADYENVRNSIDMDNYIQYQLTEIYLNNRDWPGNNIKFWNTTSPGSKWRWILFDTDFGFGIWNVNDYMLNTLEFALEPYGPDWPNPPWSTLLLRRLVTNMSFRNNFIIQFCDRLNHDFHPSRVNADLDSLKNLYDNEIVYNFNRWWSNYNEWINKISDRKTFGQYRPEYCRQHLRSKFSLGAELNVTVGVSATSEGYVKLNTIYPDKYPFTGIYFKNIPIQLTAIPKPGYRFVRWEGSVTSDMPSIGYNMVSAGSFHAVFEEASAEDVSVIINEINYASSPSLDTKDWVELMNNGIATVDLSGWVLLDSGVDSGFVFPAGTRLAPGHYLVVCRDLEDFKAVNPSLTNATGDLEFKLSGEGEIVRLFNAENELIDAVNFGISYPWPDEASGTGKTIELKNPETDNALAENWHNGPVGGTPGRANSGIVTDVNEEISTLTSLECFPNPFRDHTTISFAVTTAGTYRLEIIDLQGKIVQNLTNKYLYEGSYWIDWTGENAGEGVYALRLVGNGQVVTTKIVKLK